MTLSISSLNATACSPPEAKNFAQAVALPSFVWQSVPVMEVSEGQRPFPGPKSSYRSRNGDWRQTGSCMPRAISALRKTNKKEDPHLR